MTLSGPDPKSGDTEANGCIAWRVTKPGKYTLTEESCASGWTPTAPTSVEFDVVSAGAGYGHAFVNFQNQTITACKQNTEGGTIAGWGMTLAGPDPKSGATGANGCIAWPVTKPGLYTLTEELRSGWTPTAPTSVEFNVVSAGAGYGHAFVNFQNPTITACKVKENDGTVVSGWTINLWKDGVLFDTKTTGTNGCYTWTITAAGSYQVKEGARNFWTPVGPTESAIFVVTSGSGPYPVTTFTNHRELGCAYTQGYWKNHTGLGPQAMDPAWDAVGGPYALFLNSGMTWIDIFNTPAKGGNAWYILAYQYMAAVLNEYHGADTTVIASELALAKYLFETYPPTYDFKKDPSGVRESFITTAGTLDTFNNGFMNAANPTWPPHCGD